MLNRKFVGLSIASPKHRTVYINGVEAGNSDFTLPIPTGGCVAETRNGEGKIDFRKKFVVQDRVGTITIDLDPVVPPEKV